MLLTSPLAVTLGLSLSIPLAVAGDLYRSAPISLFSLIGGVLVLSSFVGNGILDLREAEKQSEQLVEQFGEEGERDRLLEEEEEDEYSRAGGLEERPRATGSRTTSV